MWRLSQIAKQLETALHGPDLEIVDVKTTNKAGEQELTFVTDLKNFAEFLNSPSPAAIVNESIVPELDDESRDAKSLILVSDAQKSFAEIAKLFRPTVNRARIGVSPAAHVSPSAEIGTDVDIYPGAFVGVGAKVGAGSTIFPGACVLENCEIGERVRIYPNAVLYENTIVGDDSIIHAGAVLGAFGFGYNSSGSGHQLSPQLGNVVLGAQVELGANTAIDRGTYDSTTVGDGTKIDDLVMIGHNCEIGKHNLLCSQVGIAGSCSTGNFVVMAGQVGIGDHVKIGNQVTLMAKSGVMHDITDGQILFGGPAVPVREQMKFLAIKHKLPEMRKTLKSISRRMEKLESQTVNESDAVNDSQSVDQKDAA